MNEKERQNEKGYSHPISQAIREINTIFFDMGFSFADGPELETEYYNFDSLNVPKDHPSRDMQDTFWIDDTHVMRTHTSPVQVRYMEHREPPLRIIVPGKAFRNEATDATHEAEFHQVEGLVVEEGATLATLKKTLETFFSKFFGRDVPIRFRPGHFPFTEPSVEIDILHKSAKGEEWLEVFGGGMVHPVVLKNAGIDPEKHRGFAFGGGIERLLMIRHEIDDIRLFHSGDLRFTTQF
ncbi:MAG: phenylalanine--tRNA ligase subunit alpha [Candidatus Paceibacterota bacterium]